MTVELERSTVLTILRRGKIEIKGQFLNSSNYTFLVDVTDREQKLAAVYKPVRGERPLWDFEAGTLAQREVAAFLMSESLGWNLVPPTVYRKRAALGAGSLQQYIEHDPEYHYFKFNEEDRQRLRPVVVFDLLVNNADRKGSHILCGEDRHIWLVDHGICFHTEDKLRTVLWDFAGEDIPADLLTGVQRWLEQLNDSEHSGQDLKDLHQMINAEELQALVERARQLLDKGRFPIPDKNRRLFPWPPI